MIQPTVNRIGRALLALGVAAGIVVVASAAQATFPGANGKLAFTRGGDVWVMNADGTGQTNLTPSSPGSDFGPAWSPDGTKIAFFSDRAAPGAGDFEIYVMNATVGAPATQLTNDAGSSQRPTWSPDGNEIAFETTRNGNFDIYKIPSTGGTATPLVSTTSGETGPDWSPDGSQIAFSSGAIWTMSAVDGSDKQNVTDGLVTLDTDPSWSPDGTRIAYKCQGGVLTPNQICAIDADGQNEMNVSSSTSDEEDPAWSPDGRKIAFVSMRSGEKDVFVMNADGTGGVTNLTNHAASWDQLPAWKSLRIVVNSENDPGTGTCDATECTLREAISQANASGEATGILFDIPPMSFRPPYHIVPTVPGLPAATVPVVIDATTQPGWAPRNPTIEINGSLAGPGADGLRLTGGSSVVRGLAVNGFDDAGIELAGSGGSLVEHTFLGTDPSGTVAVGNGIGVTVDTSQNNVIGNLRAGNLISGNDVGVFVRNGQNNQIRGNILGLDAPGTAVLGNTTAGIALEDSSQNEVGSTEIPNIVVDAPGGLASHGVDIEGGSNNQVIGNYIGTAPVPAGSFMNEIGQLSIGINLEDTERNTIGGTAAGAGNIVGGGDFGICVCQGSTGNGVYGNLVGVGEGGEGLGQTFEGIRILDATINAIGGDGAGEGNAVENAAIGIRITGGATGTGVLGNTIRNNTDAGVLVDVAPTVIENGIGHITPGFGNTIVGNGKGVVAQSGSGLRIRGNEIRANSELGIDLGANGVTANDPGDADTGPNGLTNFPIITSAILAGDVLTIRGVMSAAASTTYTMDFYTNRFCDPSGNGEGETYVGSANVTTKPSGVQVFAATVPGQNATGGFLTATATDPSDNTSEFSACDNAVRAPAGTNGVSGDFNGDGVDDLATGIPGEDVGPIRDAGAVSVVYGTATGLSATGPVANQHWHQDRLTLLDQAEAGDRFGSALAAGNFNGDAFEDLAIGIPGEDVSTPDAGMVSVLYGSATGLSDAGNQVWHQGAGGLLGAAGQGDEFGSSLAAANFGNSGEGDLAVGVPGEQIGPAQRAGAVAVIYGGVGGLAAASNQLWTQDSAGVQDAAEKGDAFGASLAAADLGGGAPADLAVGIPGEESAAPLVDAGAAAVLFGGAGGVTSAGNQLWSQDSAGIAEDAEPGDAFGLALATGDFDGDARVDLAIGVPGEDLQRCSGFGCTTLVEAGVAHVLYSDAVGPAAANSDLWGQDVGSIANVAGGGDQFGVALAAADLGKGAQADLVVGVSGEDFSGAPDAGAAHTIYGGATGLTDAGNQLWRQKVLADSPEASDRFGSALTVGQFGNGPQSDVGFGVPYEDLGMRLDAGAVNVAYGGATGLDAAGNQFWNQSVPNMADPHEAGDTFGSALG